MTKPRRKARVATYHSDNNVFAMRGYAEEQKIQNRKVYLKPKSEKQAEYIDVLTDWNKQLVLTTGPAGTGKSYLAVLAGIKALKEKEIEKIVITRPAVGVENESHGYLPGTMNEKMAPWTQPILDVLLEYYRQADIAVMLDEKIIELAPLAYQRGRTFKNSWVIVDESQNMTINQMKMILTRLGDNSKMIVTGDLQQTDKQFSSKNGLLDFIERMKVTSNDLFSHCEFSGLDIQRGEVVAAVLKMYGDI